MAGGVGLAGPRALVAAERHRARHALRLGQAAALRDGGRGAVREPGGGEGGAGRAPGRGVGAVQPRGEGGDARGHDEERQAGGGRAWLLYHGVRDPWISVASQEAWMEELVVWQLMK